MPEYETDLDVTSVARVFLALISILVVLVGTSGNFLVWYGSVFHSAIKLECCSRVLITNLALTDIIMIAFLYIPLGITAISGKWILGHNFCVTQGTVLLVAMLFEVFIMMSLNCYRLWAVKKTKGDRERIKPWHVQAYLLIVMVICLSCLVVFYFLAGRQLVARFMPNMGLCTVITAGAGSDDTTVNLVVLGYMVPPLVISFTTSKILKCILCYTARRAGTKNSKSQRAISLVCWAMIISYLPTYVTLIWEVFSTPAPPALHLMLPMILCINLLVNPAIYFYYNSNFRGFVLRLFHLDSSRGVVKPRNTSTASATSE